MNKHVELVKKWLENEDSVSLEDLQANAKVAYAAYEATYRAYEAAYEAAAYAAAYAAYTDAAHSAAYWVKQYEKLTK